MAVPMAALRAVQKAALMAAQKVGWMVVQRVGLMADYLVVQLVVEMVYCWVESSVDLKVETLAGLAAKP